jgi:hypothetical protein
MSSVSYAIRNENVKQELLCGQVRMDRTICIICKVSCVSTLARMEY